MSHAPSPPESVTCPACGAIGPPQGRFCWLCGAELALLAPAKEHKPADAAGAARLSPAQQRLAIWLVVILVAILGLGVAAAQDRWVAAVIPTLLVVLIGTSSARASGQPWSPGKTAAVAVTTAAGTILTTIAVTIVTLAIVVLVVLATVIALIQQCFEALGGAGA